jgi:hypothetical protein
MGMQCIREEAEERRPRSDSNAAHARVTLQAKHAKRRQKKNLAPQNVERDYLNISYLFQV